MTDRPPVAASMRAAVYRRAGVVEVQELPVPEPGPTEVLVQVSHCGICGSDVHLLVDGWARPGTVAGHEWSGTVVAAGADTGWPVGDRVVGGPSWCGACRWCRSGRPSLCVRDDLRTGTGSQGAFAEYRLCPAGTLHPLPAGLDLRAAALAEPLAVALHALTRGGLSDGAAAGARVLVTGAGPIGLLVVAALRAAGATDVTVSEPAAVRRERAGALGASTVCHPGELPTPPAAPTTVVDDPYQAALECSGTPEAVRACLGLLAPAGTLVLVGAGIRPVPVDPLRVLLGELVVTGAYNYDADGIDRALRLLADGEVPVGLLAEPDDLTLEELPAALGRLSSAAVAGKLLVRPGAGPAVAEERG